MPSQPGQARRWLEGGAALLCVLLAGWSLACIQSDRLLAAQVLATAAAGILVAALLARLPGVVDRLLARRPAENGAGMTRE